MASSSTACSVSHWHSAALSTDGETVFAIGDVHGCVDQLAILIEKAVELAALAKSTRLIFLGDLISRGPSTLDALALWSMKSLATQFDRVHRLAGNHEQLLMLSLGTGDVAEAARAKWTSGYTVIEELREATGREQAPLTRELLVDAAGVDVVTLLDRLETHVRLGNLLFVHGGVDPHLDLEQALALPWTMMGGNHWAWISEPFLAWRDGFGGTMVIHGHTPPEKHRKFSGGADPHTFRHDRLCLDGGTASTGVVVAAQIEDGRYRIFSARKSP